MWLVIPAMGTFTAEATAPMAITALGIRVIEEGEIHDEADAENLGQHNGSSSPTASDPHPPTQIVTYASSTPTSPGDAVPNLKAIYTELDEISDDISDMHSQISDIRHKLKKQDELEDMPDDIAELRQQVRELRQRLERHEEDSLESHRLFHAEIDKIKDGRRWIREEMKQQRNAREKMKRRVDELSEALVPEGPPSVKRLRTGT